MMIPRPSLALLMVALLIASLLLGPTGWAADDAQNGTDGEPSGVDLPEVEGPTRSTPLDLTDAAQEAAGSLPPGEVAKGRLPGLGAIDGWVDVEGDTMWGDLRMQDFALRFGNGALLGPQGADGLWFEGDRVCTQGTVAGCGDIEGIIAGPGLLGGGVRGTVTVGVAPEGIATAMLAAGSVSGHKLAPNAITGDKVADRSLTGWDLALGTVGKNELADGNVIASKIAPNAITGGKVADRSLTGSDLARGTVGKDELADAGVTTAKLAAATGFYRPSFTLVQTEPGPGTDILSQGETHTLRVVTPPGMLIPLGIQVPDINQIHGFGCVHTRILAVLSDGRLVSLAEEAGAVDLDLEAIGERLASADAHGTSITSLRFQAFNPCDAVVFTYGSVTASITGWLVPAGSGSFA